MGYRETVDLGLGAAPPAVKCCLRVGARTKKKSRANALLRRSSSLTHAVYAYSIGGEVTALFLA